MAYIIDLGQHIRSDEVGYGMASSSLDCTHGPTMLGVACNHGLQNAQMVGRRRAWQAIEALGQYIGSNDVGHGMPSLTLENTHDRRHQALPAIKALAKYTRSKTSGLAFLHSPCTAHTVGCRWEWHAIIALLLYTRTNKVGSGMILSPLDNIEVGRSRLA